MSDGVFARLEHRAAGRIAIGILELLPDEARADIESLRSDQVILIKARTEDKKRGRGLRALVLDVAADADSEVKESGDHENFGSRKFEAGRPT